MATCDQTVWERRQTKKFQLLHRSNLHSTLLVHHIKRGLPGRPDSYTNHPTQCQDWCMHRSHCILWMYPCSQHSSCKFQILMVIDYLPGGVSPSPRLHHSLQSHGPQRTALTLLQGSPAPLCGLIVRSFLSLHVSEIHTRCRLLSWYKAVVSARWPFLTVVQTLCCVQLKYNNYNSNIGVQGRRRRAKLPRRENISAQYARFLSYPRSTKIQAV